MSVLRMSTGRSFQIVGPETRKLQQPKRDSIFYYSPQCLSLLIFFVVHFMFFMTCNAPMSMYVIGALEMHIMMMMSKKNYKKKSVNIWQLYSHNIDWQVFFWIAVYNFGMLVVSTICRYSERALWSAGLCVRWESWLWRHGHLLSCSECAAQALCCARRRLCLEMCGFVDLEEYRGIVAVK